MRVPRIPIGVLALWFGCAGSTTVGDVTPDIVASRDAPDSTETGTPGTDAPMELPPDLPGELPIDLPGKEFVPGPDPETIPLYDESRIVEFRIDFDPAEWQKFTACWKSPPADVLALTAKCPFVHCSFTFEGQTFEDAACRPKGNPDSWDSEAKPQLLVRFNEWEPTGRFLGVRRINLEANNDYGAPVRDRLAMGLMRDAGVDASRVNHARVLLDGKPQGIYQNIEALDREFLEDHFADPTGNLFDEFWEQKTNEEVPGVARLDTFISQIDQEPLGRDHSSFAATLSAQADIDRILRILAVEILLPTVDNFKDGGGNFYWYDQPGRGFVLIPWDLDDCMSPSGEADQDPMSCQADSDFAETPSALCLLIHETPAWHSRVVDLVATWRDTKYAALAGKARDMCDQIRPYMAEEFTGEDREDALGSFEDDCAALPLHVRDRIAFLETELSR